MTWGLGLVLGFVLGAGFLVFARRMGAQGERRLLAVGLVVAALIYVGFAVAWADAMWMMIELGGVVVFTGLAVLGLKRSALSLAVGWASDRRDGVDVKVRWRRLWQGNQA